MTTNTKGHHTIITLSENERAELYNAMDIINNIYNEYVRNDNILKVLNDNDIVIFEELKDYLDALI